ncbi:LuxR C-terminal-related transcriptional regulator [Actinoplanes sp. KI2]|uniref:LuxR C-terminal-related transcriptional regulator n=1 Tax=Actinoplanes sp. KI2 TaxID=2983315 RepID=UPI0021D5DF64|nr:LuxR C-terminal-related transcriptional regulator [Actinoplanes sp. KI2]MCU7727768.1 LuxR C-terminal-related transcriptional regulator [Actinoplanes sp. KI2]
MQATAHDRRTRIAITSDRRLFRDSLAAILEHAPGLEVVGHIPEAALPALTGLSRPDIVLFDVGIDVEASLAALEAFHRRCAGTRTIVVYDRLTGPEMDRAWQAGANALIPASRALDALLLLLRRFVDRTDEMAENLLDDQERKIMALVTAGHTAAQIAELLRLTPAAVEKAKHRIYRKLGVGYQGEAVARMLGLGLLDHDLDRAPDRTGGGELLVVLRGSDPATRLAVLAALLTARVAVQQELQPCLVGKPWDEVQRGPVVLVLLDPGATEWMRADDGTTPTVLVHSGPLCRAQVADLLLHGVCAIVAAERVRDDLPPVLAVVSRGYLSIDTGEARALLSRHLGPAGDAGLPDLTPREAEILRSIALGHTVRQTARALGIAVKTVENTQARMFRKLGTHNRVGSLRVAHSLGLVETEEPVIRAAR